MKIKIKKSNYYITILEQYFHNYINDYIYNF